MIPKCNGATAVISNMKLLASTAFITGKHGT